MPEWTLRAPLRPTAIASTLATSGDLQSVDPLTTATLSGPSTAQTGVAVTYTITLNVPAAQTYVVTPSCPGATLAPGSFDINAGNSTGQFAVTAPSDGTYSVDFTISPTLTRTGRPISLVAQTSPVTLAYDAQTPHQISIAAPHARTLAEGSTGQVYYRVTGSGSWIDGGYLYRTRTSQGSAANTFAGWVVDLQPGTTYDVRLDVTEPGVGSWQITGTRATRALPAEGAAQTKSATTANFTSVMAGAVAGDVIVLAAGTYTLSGFGWTSPGTSGSPVVIRGNGIDSTILVDSTGVVLSLSGSYFTFEDMTVRGSQSDAGATPSSTGVVLTTGVPTNATFRRIKFDGVDIGVMRDGQVNGLLIYDCNFVGNNPWSSTYTPITDGYPQDTWNDTGVRAPGFGNCVWNCTFVGFGDTIKLGHRGGWGGARACYIYRNWVKYGGDDGCEFDESDGNCAFYDNRLANTAMGASFDGVDSGPVGLFRNVFVNQTRAPMKFTSAARGARIHNNTWVGTTRTSSPNWDYGMYAASGSLYDFDFRNNLLIYRGAGALISFNQSLYGSTVTDYNAWYPDGRNIHFGSGSGTWTGLTSAKANLAPRMAHDVIVGSDPFASPITLGADYTTEYTGHLDARITSGAARNAGVPITGVTDGFTGAAPDIGADITGRTTPAIGATSNPYMPEWARTQTAQTWSVVPTANTLDSLDPRNNPAINPNYPSGPEWAGSTGQASIVSAWCGAAYDEATDTMWLGIGGGHTNYGGNEVYRCRFSTPAPTWELVRRPSGAIGNLLTTNDGQEASGVYSDGRPRAVHGYNKWVYVPGVGPVMGVHGNTSYSGQIGKHWSLFIDPATGEHAYSVEHSLAGYSSSSATACCYDPSRHAIWIAPPDTSSIYRYNIPTSGGAHTGAAASLIGNTGSVRAYGSLTYLPGFDCLLVGNSGESGGGSWRVFDCATGTSYAPTFNGTPAMGATQGKAQPRWVPSLGAVCAWNNLSNTTQITKFTPGVNPRTDAWTVSTLPVDGSNTVTPSAAVNLGGGGSTFGRFAYSPRLGGFLVFNSTSGSHYFYKI